MKTELQVNCGRHICNRAKVPWACHVGMVTGPQSQPNTLCSSLFSLSGYKRNDTVSHTMVIQAVFKLSPHQQRCTIFNFGQKKLMRLILNLVIFLNLSLCHQILHWIRLSALLYNCPSISVVCPNTWVPWTNFGSTKSVNDSICWHMSFLKSKK